MNKKISKKEKEEIYKLYKQGYTKEKLAEMYDVHKYNINYYIYYIENYDEIKKKAREKWYTNRDEIKKYRERNKEKLKTYQKEYNKKNNFSIQDTFNKPYTSEEIEYIVKNPDNLTYKELAEKLNRSRNSIIRAKYYYKNKTRDDK